MLVDIFSAFDENNFTFMSFTPIVWILSLLPLMVAQSQYWVKKSRWESFLFIPQSFMSGQVARTFGRNLTGFSNFVVSLFVMLIFINLLGLPPYIFSVSSHLSFAFCFGFPLWLSLILSGVFYNLSEVIAHLLPSGAPSSLNPFLVLVETVSISVRPITLSIRLVANMSAGHIILGLIGSYLSVGVFLYPKLILFFLIFIQIFYFIFEIGISLIQAYIFSLLITLYSEDHPS